jgi:ribosomal protein S18 acetylase RimI-like enzyme
MHYDVAKSSDADAVVRLLAQVFSEAEPPAVAMALSAADLEQFLRLIVSSVVADGLTVISRTAETGGLTGVLFTDDFAKPPTLDVARITPKFLPILSMLDRLDQQFRKGKTISPGEYLHLFMLGVDRQFAGQGIGQQLIRACLDNGSRRGYRTALTEATGRVSQHIFRKNGFSDQFSVAYSTFTYENRLVFASIREHEGAILMGRSLACEAPKFKL